MTDSQHSTKPSLRQRLFSNSSRKSHKHSSDVHHSIAALPSTSIPVMAEPSSIAEHPEPSPDASVIPFPDSQHSTSLDRERGSLKTPFSGNRRIPFYRRTAYISSSEEALSSSASHSIVKPMSKSSPSRPSLISRVVNRVVPCVHPTPDTLHVDDEASPASDSRQSLALKDLSTIKQNGSDSPPLDSENQKETQTDLPGSTPPSTTYLQSSPDQDSSSPLLFPPPLSDDEADILKPDDVRSPPPDDKMDIHILDSSDDEIESHEDILEDLKRRGGSGIPFVDGIPKPLLPPIAPEHAGRKCLVLDLDETLVHSSFRAVQQADFIVPVEIEYHWHHFHVLKRPGVDDFLKKMGELYEVVVFTASLSKYADPVLDRLDIHRVVAHRLFRESCFSHAGNYIKDLSQLGRPVADTIILDNSPASYIFHPNNAVPVSSWFNDPHDAELTDLVPFLSDLTFVPDVRGVLNSAR